MSSVVIKGDTSGQITLSAPAVAGTNTLTLPTITGTIGTLNSGTAVASTSGTSIDFTGIPTGVRRITVMFSGVSTSGTSPVEIRLGTSGGVESTGYLSGANGITGTNTCFQQVSTTGVVIIGALAASTRQGQIQISNISGNIWSAFGCIYRSDDGAVGSLSATKTLSGTLDRIRITTVGGTDTFDAGSINILYE